jgi:hypothetical protein
MGEKIRDAEITEGSTWNTIVYSTTPAMTTLHIRPSRDTAAVFVS